MRERLSSAPSTLPDRCGDRIAEFGAQAFCVHTVPEGRHGRRDDLVDPFDGAREFSSGIVDGPDLIVGGPGVRPLEAESREQHAAMALEALAAVWMRALVGQPT